MASLQFFITVLTLVLGNIRAKDEILSSVTCERRTMEITCNGNVIRIVNASYGRHIRNIICPNGNKANTIGCHAESSMNIVETYCNGKDRCNIPARNRIFGDPCVGVYKYLSVNYTCQACNTVEPTTRTDCGYSGISEEDCLSRGCCFDNSIPNVNWCFFQAKPQGAFTTTIQTDTDTYDPTNLGNVTDENNIHGTTYTFYDTSSAETNTEEVVGGVVGAVGVVAIILAVVGVLVYRRRYKTAELNLANSTKPEAPEYYNVPFHSNIRTTTSTIQNHDQALPNGTQQDTSLNENEGIYEPIYLENKEVYTHLQNTTGSEMEPRNIDSSCGYTALNLPNVSDRRKKQETVNSYFEVESTNHDTDDYAYAYGQFDKKISN